MIPHLRTKVALCLVASVLPLLAQPSITEFHQGVTAGSSPSAITLGPDGACWFVETQAQQIGRITATGDVSEYSLPHAAAGLNGITTGPDGAIWFTEGALDRIGRMTTGGVLTNEFALAPGSTPFAIVTGPDYALWFTEQGTGKIGRMALDGSVKEFALPWTGSRLSEITLGPRGALWFTDGSGNIGQVSIAGAFTRYPLPNPAAAPRGITPGPDNALWFTEPATGKIGRITVGAGGPLELGLPPAGVIAEYTVPSKGAPQGIFLGPDNAFWFTEPLSNRLGRIDLSGAVTEFDVPSAPQAITIGPDGVLWFTEGTGQIGRALPEGGPWFSEFPAPFSVSPSAVAPGPDGAVWYSSTTSGIIGRVNPAGALATVYQSTFTPNEIGFGSDGTLWFADLYRAGVGKIVAGTRVEYSVPFAAPGSIQTGPDGAIWFSDHSQGHIGRITADGVFTLFPIPNAAAIPYMTLGPDGALWFTMIDAQRRSEIGRLTPEGSVTEYLLPTPGTDALNITVGPDGALWFSEYSIHKIGRINTSGKLTEYPIRTSTALPGAIAAGPDGALWFSEGAGQLGRITTGGVVTDVPMPGNQSGPLFIVTGPDGGLWFGGPVRWLVLPSSAPPVATRFFATNPPGGTVMVDGINYTTPQSFTWPVGSRHTIGAIVPAGGPGVRYAFKGWSDGQSQNHTITAGSGPTVFVANFAVQYQLTLSGTVVAAPASADGYYDAGTPVQLTAQAPPGFQFVGWGGEPRAVNNPRTVVVGSPLSIAAVFAPSTCVVTLSSSSASFDAAGGSGAIGVVTDSACPWQAASAAPWVRIVNYTGTGSGTITYTVGPSMGGARNAVLTVGGAVFQITQGLSAISVAPASGSGINQTFTFQFSNPAGYQNLGIVNILINSALDARQACYLAYSQPSRTLYLTNNLGVAGQGIALDGVTNVANGQCVVNGAGSSASGSGAVLTLTLSLGFGPNFKGAKIVYLAAGDQSGNNSGWQPFGVWTVPGPPASGSAVGTASPGRSVGEGQTYTFTFTDTNGTADLGVVDILINSALVGSGACYLAYSVPLKVLYLADDQNGSLSAGLVPGGTGSAGNGQCAVYSVGSSVSADGNTLTLNLNLAFLPAFTGNRIVYMAARNRTDAQNSGWQAAGTITIP